jgi:hypothetical protein
VNNGGDILEDVSKFLPEYLTPKDKKQLWKELKSFPDGFCYYASAEELQDELLQGDAWEGFQLRRFSDGQVKKVTGVILSNSCDISPDNERKLPVGILFSPVIPLKAIRSQFEDAGLQEQQIASYFESLREQKITSAFYLPEKEGALPESVILLNDVHTHPQSDFLNGDPASVATLSQPGFYLFLLKLSIHFSRFQEDVNRFGRKPSA